MRISKLSATVMLAGLYYSNAAFAVIDAQALVGQRRAAVKNSATDLDDNLSGTEVGADFHYYPIPMFPIGLGAFYNAANYAVTTSVPSSTNTSFSADKFSGYEAGLDVSFVMPSIRFIPYAKVGYVLASQYTAVLNNQDLSTVDLGKGDLKAQYEATGYHLSAGIAWRVTPLTSLLLQGDLARETLKQKKIIYPNGSTTSDVSDKIDVNAPAISAGLELSL